MDGRMDKCAGETLFLIWSLIHFLQVGLELIICDVSVAVVYNSFSLFIADYNIDVKLTIYCVIT